MIFATVGTHHQPFTRLLDALEESGLEDLVVQYGPGRPPAAAARAVDYLPFEEMLACFREADAVITHAGVGSILCATREGHTPLVVPRRHDLGEHVDDHQVELTRALERRGSVISAWDVDRIPELLAGAAPRRSAVEAVEPALCGAIRGALAQSSEA